MSRSLWPCISFICSLVSNDMWCSFAVTCFVLWHVKKCVPVRPSSLCCSPFSLKWYVILHTKSCCTTLDIHTVSTDCLGPHVPADLQATNLGVVKWFSICFLWDPSEPQLPPPFCPSLSVPVASRLAFEFQSALDALLCLFEGDGLDRLLAVVSGCVRQSNIHCDPWAAHWRIGWCVLRGHKALTAARGGKAYPTFFTRRPPSPRHPPPNVNTGSTINNSLTLLLLPPPYPLRLLLWSSAPCFPFINTAFDVGFIILCQHPPPPQHLDVCNCIRFVMVAHLFGPPRLVLGQRASFPCTFNPRH